jgi:biopolymer transport protein ExbB
MSLPLAAVSDVIEFFVQGGFFMALLLICSLISVAVMVLRALALRRDFVMPPDIEREINSLKPEDTEGSARLARRLRNDPSPLGRIILTGVQHLSWPKSENMEAVQTRARHEIVRLESGLATLEVIVGIAPLLGLLGAVAGLKKVFGALGKSGSPDAPILASGISEALSTTIVGLAIAIPSLIAYSYFSKKIEIMAAEMESLVADLLAKCYFQRARRYTARVSSINDPAPQPDYSGATAEYSGATAEE